MKKLILGLMRGDEGKGKITDYFADKSDIVIRYAGSCNAGHTIYRNNEKIVLHQIPSGILDKKICIIGRGCLIDLKKLWDEIVMLDSLIKKGHLSSYKKQESVLSYLKISAAAHLIFQKHIEEDIKREDSGNGNGSTKCGIAPGYRDKYYRSGIRVWDLIKIISKYSEPHQINDDVIVKGLNVDYFILEKICKLTIDEEIYLNSKNIENKNLLFEGAQGVLLDINSPYYPNVSSSSVGVDGVISGTGINYNRLIKDFEVIGVVKSYMSSVGVGKFLTQLDGIDDKSAKLIRDAGNEYGATTGRPRKVGWFDIPLLNYSIRTSGANSICLTRLDTLMEAFKDIGEFKVCVSYVNKYDKSEIKYADIWELDDYEPRYKIFKIWNKCSLSDENFLKFIKFIQQHIGTKIKYISIGQNKEDILVME